ncbi:MAG: glycosyltransferase [Actinomycetota bacterium]
MGAVRVVGAVAGLNGSGPRVLFVGPSAGARGGIAQFNARLAETVATNAHVRAIGFERMYPSWTDAGRRQPAAAGHEAFLVPWRPRTWMRAARELREFGPDLVVVQWWHPLFAPCLRHLIIAARRNDAEVMMVCHNALPHEPFPLARAAAARTMSAAGRLVALSTAVAAQVRTLAPGARIDVLAHPPNLAGHIDPMEVERWRARVGPVDGPMIVFFGNVRPYKGLSDLIEAMPAVCARSPATLVVAGTFYEPVERFRLQARRLGVESSIRLFPGYVPDDEVLALLSLADVVAMPYRTASQSGILPLVALAERPVVATSVGGITEAVGDRGVVVPPGDGAALAQGLLRALATPPLPPHGFRDGWSRWAALVVEAASDAGDRAYRKALR